MTSERFWQSLWISRKSKMISYTYYLFQQRQVKAKNPSFLVNHLGLMDKCVCLSCGLAIDDQWMIALVNSLYSLFCRTIDHRIPKQYWLKRPLVLDKLNIMVLLTLLFCFRVCKELYIFVSYILDADCVFILWVVQLRFRIRFIGFFKFINISRLLLSTIWSFAIDRSFISCLPRSTKYYLRLVTFLIFAIFFNPSKKDFSLSRARFIHLNWMTVLSICW